MFRSIYKKLLCVLMLFTLSTFYTATINAQQDKQSKPETTYVAGNQYFVLKNPLMEQKPDTISIKIFFWYGCPHCQLLEKEIQSWQTSVADYVKIEKIPVAFGSPWSDHAKLYYTAEQLKLGAKAHDALFINIQNRSLDFTKIAVTTHFFNETFKVNEKEFLKAYNSFDIKNKVNRAAKLGKLAQLTGIPSIIVNEKYKVNLSKLHSLNEAILVTNFLIKKERDNITKKEESYL